MPEKRTCLLSGQTFEITDKDIEFYNKIGIPFPTLCPMERQRRRFTFRNERHLYKNKSALSGKKIISCIHPNDPWKVYSQEEWWGDSWDGLDFSRPYDFSKTFIEQYFNLQKKVPVMAANSMNNENCPYANYAASCKNCHLIFGSVYCEDCLYGNPYYSKSCIDSLLIRDCQFCYECITCENCYECLFCQDCVNSYNLIYCYDCQGSKNCIGCAGLRNKEYHIFNKPYSKEEFLKYKNTLSLCDPNIHTKLKKEFEKIKVLLPRRFGVLIQAENCTGNYIYSSKNANSCFDVQRVEDSSYCAQVIDMKDCYDCNYMEEVELACEFICNYRNQKIFFSVWTHGCNDIWYSSYCVSSHNLFGCIGLKHKKYCILNKQYTKEEYENLVPRIKEQMKKDEIFGEFFPPSISLFCYNETVANEYFPLTKEETLIRGYRWREKNPKDYQKQKIKIEADIKNVSDAITNEILSCSTCEKNFRITPQELKFYQKFELPIPNMCPDCRHRDRMNLRSDRTILNRVCNKCNKKIETTYSEKTSYKIYCEECYLKTIY